MHAVGFPRNLGGPLVSTERTWYRRARQPSEVGWARGSRSTSYYLRDRGTHPRGPCGGKGVPGYGTAGGKDGGNIESHNRLNGTSADSGMGASPLVVTQRIRTLKSRMREICKSGSVGDLGRQLPRSTRHPTAGVGCFQDGTRCGGASTIPLPVVRGLRGVGRHFAPGERNPP
jgi:hypothetical protein